MKRKTTEEFIKESNLLHGDKYDYSKVKYVGAYHKVIITCKVTWGFCSLKLSRVEARILKKI